MKEVEMQSFNINAPVELFKALAQFQYECPVIHKATKGFSYTYTDLPTIIGTITPILKKHDLAFTQLIHGKGIRTILFHFPSGQSIESTIDMFDGFEMKGMNQLQSYGSQLTYMKRYALSSILGIVTDSDTDGQGKPKQMATKEDPNEKKKLNQRQFVRAMTEIQSGKYTKQFIIDSFDLTEDQRLSIDEMNA